MGQAKRSGAAVQGLVKRSIGGLVAALGLSLAACAGPAAALPEPAAAHASEPAPTADITLQDLSGHRVGLSDFGGKPRLVVFWRPGRTNAESELVSLRRLRERMSGAVEVIAIAALYADDASEADARRLAEDRAPGLPVLVMSHVHEAPAWADAAGMDPFFALVGPDGRVSAMGHDAVDWTARETEARLARLAGGSRAVASR